MSKNHRWRVASGGRARLNWVTAPEYCYLYEYNSLILFFFYGDPNRIRTGVLALREAVTVP
jgi:hypothetical protein